LMSVQAQLAPEEQSLRRLQLETQREAAKVQAATLKATLDATRAEQYQSFADKAVDLVDKMESPDPDIAEAANSALSRLAARTLPKEDAAEVVGMAGDPGFRELVRAYATPKVAKELTTQDIAKLPLQERVDYLNTQAQLEGKNTKTVGNNIFMQEFVVQDGKVVPIIKPIEGATTQQDQAFLDQLDKNPGLKKYYTDIGKQLAQTETTKGSVIQSAESFVELLDEMIANTKGRIAAQGPAASRIVTVLPETLKYERDFERLKGSLFLKEVPNMAGMGSLSNAEGAKVAAAASNLDLVLSPENALAELERLRESAIKVPLVIAADTERLQQLLTTPVGGGLRVPGERVPIERRMSELVNQGRTQEEAIKVLQDEGYFQ